MTKSAWCFVSSSVVVLLVVSGAAQTARSVPPVGGSVTYGALTVKTIADGLQNPWSLAFLPGGDILVTERAGRLRIIRNGVLDPKPIAGVPTAYVVRIAGLMEVALHPRFTENGYVYLTYNKLGPPLPPGEASPLSSLAGSIS